MKISAISNYKPNYQALNQKRQHLESMPCSNDMNFGHAVKVNNFRKMMYGVVAGLGLAALIPSFTQCGKRTAWAEANAEAYVIINGDTIPVNPTPGPSPSPSPEVTVNDSISDTFTEIIGPGTHGDSLYIGPDHIAGRMKFSDLYFNKGWNIALDTVMINDSTALNAKFDGNIVSLISPDSIPISGQMAQIPLAPNEAFSGSTSKYGILIPNVSNITAGAFLFVPNNDRNEIFVFNYDNGKVLTAEIDPKAENSGYSKEPANTKDIPTDAPDNCNIVLKKNANGKLYIYARQNSNSDFYLKSAEYEMHNK